VDKAADKAVVETSNKPSSIPLIIQGFGYDVVSGEKLLLHNRGAKPLLF
jgi:hypothetical protein